MNKVKPFAKKIWKNRQYFDYKTNYPKSNYNILRKIKSLLKITNFIVLMQKYKN